MTRFLPIGVLLVLSCLSIRAQTANDSIGSEPKTTFEIFISGKKYLLAEGEVLKFDTTFARPSISVKISDRKKFETTAVAFEYPKHLSFAFEKDTGYKNWTLSGNNLVVMFFEIDGKATASNLVEAMVEKFGKKNCTMEDFQKELGHKLLNGKRLHVSFADTKITFDFYEIISSDAVSRFISFQDTIKDNGDYSDEYKSGFDMINATIVYHQ